MAVGWTGSGGGMAPRYCCTSSPSLPTPPSPPNLTALVKDEKVSYRSVGVEQNRDGDEGDRNEQYGWGGCMYDKATSHDRPVKWRHKGGYVL